MNTFTAILTAITGFVIEPFSGYPVTVLIVASILCGVGMTWVFGKTSNQAALQRTVDRSKAQLLAIRLFKEDLGVTLGAQGTLLKATGWRLVQSLVPMTVLLVPFVLLLTQLAVYYEFQPHAPGDRTVVTMEVAEEAWGDWRMVEPEVTPGLVVETAAHRDDDAHELAWRVRVVAAEQGFLSWHVGDEIVTKRVDIAPAGLADLQPISPQRPGAVFIDQLLYPAEHAFASTGPVRSIRVAHGSRSTPILGVDLPWWATFLIVSMAAALACRRRLGVVF